MVHFCDFYHHTYNKSPCLIFIRVTNLPVFQILNGIKAVARASELELSNGSIPFIIIFRTVLIHHFFSFSKVHWIGSFPFIIHQGFESMCATTGIVTRATRWKDPLKFGCFPVGLFTKSCSIKIDLYKVQRLKSHFSTFFFIFATLNTLHVSNGIL